MLYSDGDKRAPWSQDEEAILLREVSLKISFFLLLPFRLRNAILLFDKP